MNPSTYLLHLHIGFGKEIEIEGTQRHFIHNFSDVISNLESDTKYYTKPISINVRNISDWKFELDKYKNLNSDVITSKSNSSTLWDFFENMDCYKNY